MKALLIILSFNFINYQNDISEVRNLYMSAYLSDFDCTSFGERLNEMNKTSVLIKGYRGCFYFIKCQFIKNPFKKIKYFVQGKELLESAIKEDPQSVELKFLRYSIQKNLPRFLLYDKNLENDLRYVKNNISKIKDKKEQEFITKNLKSISE